MPSKARAHFCSTPSAIAKGRNFSNISGVFSTRAMRSLSTRTRNSSKPSTPSRARAPAAVRAGITQAKAKTTAAESTPAKKTVTGVAPRMSTPALSARTPTRNVATPAMAARIQ